MFRVDAASGKVTRLTRDGHFDNVRVLPGGGVIATMNSIMAPDNLTGSTAAAVSRSSPTSTATGSPSSIQCSSPSSVFGANNDTVWGWTLEPQKISS